MKKRSTFAEYEAISSMAGTIQFVVVFSSSIFRPATVPKMY
jgi:hypothetical protein